MCMRLPVHKYTSKSLPAIHSLTHSQNIIKCLFCANCSFNYLNLWENSNLRSGRVLAGKRGSFCRVFWAHARSFPLRSRHRIPAEHGAEDLKRLVEVFLPPPHCCDGNRLSSGHGWEREMGWCRAATTEAPAVQVERRRSKFFFFSEILEMKSVAFPDRLGHGEGKKGIKDIANVCDRGADILESIIATQKTAGDLRTGSKV